MQTGARTTWCKASTALKKTVKLPGQLKKANGQLSRIFILRLDDWYQDRIWHLHPISYIRDDSGEGVKPIQYSHHISALKMIFYIYVNIYIYQICLYQGFIFIHSSFAVLVAFSLGFQHYFRPKLLHRTDLFGINPLNPERFTFKWISIGLDWKFSESA